MILWQRFLAYCAGGFWAGFLYGLIGYKAGFGNATVDAQLFPLLVFFGVSASTVETFARDVRASGWLAILLGSLGGGILAMVAITAWLVSPGEWNSLSGWTSKLMPSAWLAIVLFSACGWVARTFFSRSSESNTAPTED